MKENAIDALKMKREEHVVDKRMKELASQPAREQKNMRQNFCVNEQDQSHASNNNCTRPQTLVHFKDPNFAREHGTMTTII